MGNRQSAIKWAWFLAIGLAIGCSDPTTSERGDASARSLPKAVPTRPSAPADKLPIPTPSSASPPSQSSPPSPTPMPAAKDTRSAAERIEAGRAVYNANCIACHNIDPTKDGALGPAVAGSAFELIEARVMRSEYPEGYSPKRDTRVMVALPHLEPKLNELTAYLGSLH